MPYLRAGVVKSKLTIQDTEYRQWLTWTVNRYAGTLDAAAFREKLAAADTESKRSAVAIAWLFAHEDRDIEIDKDALSLVCRALFRHLSAGDINPFGFEWIGLDHATPREAQTDWHDVACHHVFSSIMFGGEPIGVAQESAAGAVSKTVGAVRKAWAGKPGEKYRQMIAAAVAAGGTERR